MASFLKRWKDGLARTSRATFSQIVTLVGQSEVDEHIYDELEALLIQADLGVETSLEVIAALRTRARSGGITQSQDLMAALRDELISRLATPPELVFTAKPSVVLITGVNGSGKTTTIAKLGKYFTSQGLSVLLGAADTYRAAAVDQLQIWAERLDLPIVSGQPGGDSGAVAYDAVQSAISKGKELVLIDTAGRLHTRYNLMEELKKVHRVAGKALPGAPHAVWLVLDATTGQNALPQGRAFKEAVQVTGVILAKLDSSAKGGMAFAIQRELGLPILFAGLGETVEDLQPFDPQAFVDGILNSA
ncbi:MAG: signal recognition particle-docking protein FtsY [Anaerolineales bacterium]|nr:signal recognition particle-docking protein FtsY [Anaerolineales bacterium]